MSSWNIQQYDNRTNILLGEINVIRSAAPEERNSEQIENLKLTVGRMIQCKDSLKTETLKAFKDLHRNGRRRQDGRLPLPPDTAANFRSEGLLNAISLTTMVYIFEYWGDKYNGDIGISWNRNSGIFTTYISDVVRHISPEHNNGHTLGSLFRRAEETIGLQERMPIFPDSYKELMSFGGQGNDGSAIAVRYRLNEKVDTNGNNQYEIEPLSINFAQIPAASAKYVHCDLIDELLQIDSTVPSADLLNQGVPPQTSDISDTDSAASNPLQNMIANNAVNPPQAQQVFPEAPQLYHLRDICNRIRDFRSFRMVRIPPQERIKYGKPIKENNLRIRLRNPYDIDNPEFRTALGKESLKTVRSGLFIFDEISAITNQAVGMYCHARKLPIYYRGPENDVNGIPIVATRAQPNVSLNPIPGAEAGMNFFSPCINACKSSLEYTNQYLLHQHLKLRSKDIGDNENPQYVQKKLNYKSFISKVCDKGLDDFLKSTQPRASTEKILLNLVRHKAVLQMFHGTFQRMKQLPVKVQQRMRITLNDVTRRIEGNKGPIYNGLVFLEDYEYGLTNFRFRGDVDLIWDDEDEPDNFVKNMTVSNVLFTKVHIARNECTFRLDPRSQIE